MPFIFLIIPVFFFAVAVRFVTRFLGEFMRDTRRNGRYIVRDQRFGGLFGDAGVFRLGAPVNPESRVFRIAYKLKGRVTISDIVLETNLGVQEAEELLNKMVDDIHVRMEVSEKGIVIYEFPEILARFEGNPDQ